jgi:multidrug efflux pump subunit AcrB
MVDINPELLFSRGLTPIDISNALGNQNLILPAGDVKIGDKDYQVKVNSSPRVLADLNNMPIKVVNGATVYLGDVAQVHDGYAVQSSIVRINGTRGALLTVLRNGQASTLAVVNNVKKALPRILTTASAGAPGAPVLRSVPVRARGH